MPYTILLSQPHFRLALCRLRLHAVHPPSTPTACTPDWPSLPTPITTYHGAHLMQAVTFAILEEIVYLQNQTSSSHTGDMEKAATNIL